MQTTAADRDDAKVEITRPIPADDDATQDVFDLWRDLGGSD